MTACDHATETTLAASRPAIAVRLVYTVSNFIRAWRNRRAFYQLGEMSDAELADIGLTRSDLSVAVTFGSDPTAHLGSLSRARIRQMEDAARRIA